MDENNKQTKSVEKQEANFRERDERDVPHNIVETFVGQMRMQVLRWENGNVQQKLSAKRRMQNIVNNTTIEVQRVTGVNVVKPVVDYGSECLPDIVMSCVDVISEEPVTPINQWKRRVLIELYILENILVWMAPLPEAQMDTEVTYKVDTNDNQVDDTVGASNDRSRPDVLQPPWSIATVARKEVWRSSGAFKTTDAMHNVTSIADDKANFTNPMLNSIMAGFQYYTYDYFNILLRYNPNMFCAGRYILIATQGMDDPTNAAFRASSGLYSTEFSLCSGGSCLLRLPWIRQQEIQYLSETGYGWDISLVCVSPLKVPDTSPTDIPFQITTYYENFQAFMPRAQMGPTHVSTRPGMPLGDHLEMDRQRTRDTILFEPGYGLSDMMFRSCIINHESWTPAHATGTVLITVDVTPSYGETWVGVDNTIMNWHQYVAMHYRWWTGSDIFYIDPVSHSKAAGSLIMCWLPDITLPQPTKLSQMTSLKHVILNLDEQTSDRMTSIVTEWHTTVPYKNITWEQGPNNWQANGMIIVAVYNPLRCPSGSPQSVEVLVRHMPGRDRNFRVPYISTPLVDTVLPVAQMGPNETNDIGGISQDLNPTAAEFVPSNMQRLRQDWNAIEVKVNDNSKNMLSGTTPTSQESARRAGLGYTGPPANPEGKSFTPLDASTTQSNSKVRPGGVASKTAGGFGKNVPPDGGAFMGGFRDDPTRTTISTIGGIAKSAVDVAAGVAMLALCPEPFQDGFTRSNLKEIITTTVPSDGWYTHIDLAFKKENKWPRRFNPLFDCSKGFTCDFTFYIWAQASLSQNLIVTHVPPEAPIPTVPELGFESFGGSAYTIGPVNSVIPFTINTETRTRFMSFSGYTQTGSTDQTSMGYIQLWMPNALKDTALNIACYVSFNNLQLYGPYLPPNIKVKKSTKRKVTNTSEPIKEEVLDESGQDFRTEPCSLAKGPRTRLYHRHRWTDKEMKSLLAPDGALVLPTAQMFGIEEATSAMREASEAVTGLVTRLREGLTTYVLDPTVVEKAVSVILHIVLMFQSNSVGNFLLISAALLTSLGLASSVVTKIYTQFHSKELEQSAIVSQSGGAISIIRNIIAACITYVAFGATTVGENIWDFINTIGPKLKNLIFFDKGVIAITHLCTYATAIIKAGCRFFSRTTINQDELRRVCEKPELFMDFIKYLDEAESEAGAIKIRADPQGQEVLQHWHRFCMHIVSALIEESVSDKHVAPGVAGILRTYCDRFMKIYNILHNSRSFPQQERMHPYFICIAGPSRAGKSYFVRRLADRLATEFQYPEHHAIYARNCADKFMSGYQQQPIYLNDDAFQRRDGCDGEAEEIVAMGSTSPYLTNQAELTNKGRPFTSHFVILCTNTPYPEWNMRNTNESVWARRHTFVWTHPRNEEQELAFDDMAPLTPGPPPKRTANSLSDVELCDRIVIHARAHLLSQARALKESPGSVLLRRKFGEEIDEPIPDKNDFIVDPKAGYTTEGLGDAIFTRATVKGISTWTSTDDSFKSSYICNMPDPTVVLKERPVATVANMEADGVLKRFLRSVLAKSTTLIQTPWIQMLLFGLTLAGGAYALTTLIAPHAQAAYSASRTALHRAVRSMPYAQNGTEKNNADIMRARVQGYDIQIYSSRGNVRGIPLRGRTIVCPSHVADGEPISVRVNNLQWVVPPECTHIVPERDVMFIYMPRNCNAFPNNTKLFISESNLSKLGKFNVSVWNGNQQLEPTTAKVQGHLKYTTASDTSQVFSLAQHCVYKSRGLAEGDCGALIFHYDSPFQTPFIGFHVAGWDTALIDLGYGNILTREFLDEYAGEDVCIGPLLPVESTSCLEGLDAGIVKIGRVPSALAVNMPERTSLRSSCVDGALATTLVGPALMTRRDPRNINGVDPLYNSISKFGKTIVPFSREDVDAAMHGVLTELLPFATGQRIWTEHEAINGTAESDYHHGIDFSTSPGYPYTKHTKHGKHELFTTEPNNRSICDAVLRSRLDERLEALAKGERVNSVWIDVFKDEKRAMDKVLAGKTRIITIGPVDYTIAFRMYFGEFAAKFYSAHNDIFSAVGMNPESLEWTLLYDYLAHNSPIGFDSDFSNFDGSIHPDLIMAIADIATAWYDDDYALERRVLMHELAYTNHLVKHHQFVTVVGHPSGNPITSILNTVANYMILYCAWRGIMRSNNLPTDYEGFRNCVRAKMYGDDNLVSVVRERIDVFNRVTVAEYLAGFGFNMTSANKDAKIETHDTLDKLVFLKRGFRRCDRGLWHAPIDRSVINELVNWIRSGDAEQLTRDNCVDAIRFALQHGRKYFTEVSRKVNRALASAGIPGVSLAYDDLHVELY